jgi:hypothetical protein
LGGEVDVAARADLDDLGAQQAAAFCDDRRLAYGSVLLATTSAGSGGLPSPGGVKPLAAVGKHGPHGSGGATRNDPRICAS